MKNENAKKLMATLLTLTLLAGFSACSKDESLSKENDSIKKSQENSSYQEDTYDDTGMVDSNIPFTENYETSENDSIKKPQENSSYQEDTYDDTGMVDSNIPFTENYETSSLNVTAKDGLEISANTKHFTTSLTKEEISGNARTKFRAYESNKNNFPVLFSPVSSNMYVSKSLPKFYSASINNSGLITATPVASDTESGYVAFDIFVKVSHDQKVYWNETTVTCADNEDVPSAMRVALINCGTVSPDADFIEIQNTLPANANDNRVVMYEPNSTNHTDASGYKDGDVVPDRYITSAFSSCTLSGNGNNIIQNAQYTSPAFGTRATDENKDENAYFVASAGINRIRVYIWLEGNDVDCGNDVAAATLDCNITFTIV